MPSGTSFFMSVTPFWKYLSFEPFSMASSEPMPRYDLNFLPLKIIVSPGDSSAPATSEPIITELPPAARALTMSPEYLKPPSAIMGTSVPAKAHETSYTAESCGTPTPATTRVVQIEPGPIPTLMPSAPASTRALAASPVATFPTIISCSGNAALAARSLSITPCE